MLKKTIIYNRASICPFLGMPPTPRILKSYIQVIMSWKLLNMRKNIRWCHSGKALQVPPTIIQHIFQAHNSFTYVSKWNQLEKGIELCPINIWNGWFSGAYTKTISCSKNYNGMLNTSLSDRGTPCHLIEHVTNIIMKIVKLHGINWNFRCNKLH